MKKLSILIISAAIFGFFSCASKPEPQLQSDITSSENKEAVIEEESQPITEPEVLEDNADSLEEIDEPDVTELPPAEDDGIEDVIEADDNTDDAEIDAESTDDANAQEGDDKEGLAANTEDAESSSENENEQGGITAESSENTLTDAASETKTSSESTNEAENSEENAEENSEDDIEIDENEENAENAQTFPISRSVSLKVSEYLDISYPGNGWIFMGATDNSKNITYFGRKLGTQNTNFSLQARLPGTKILHFYKNDNLTNQIIDDYIEVTVLEERGSSQTHVEAPEYKMPVKAKRPAVKAAPAVEEAPDFPETDNQADEVISLVSEENKKPAQKPKTAQKTAAAPAPATTSAKTPASAEAPAASQTQPAQTEAQAQAPKASDSDLKNLLSDAQNKFTQKDYKSALNSINEYLSNSKDKRDEALFLQGQILEAKSDLQDIAKAIDSYTTLTKNYPASKFWDKANKRIIYLKRFYLQGR